MAFLPFGEIAAARMVREDWQRPERRAVTERRAAKWLELRLRHRNTEILRQAVAAEMARNGPRRNFLGISGRSRMHHSPVIVPEAGVVRAEWRGRAMLAALSGKVPAAGAHDAGLVVGQDDGLPLEERVRRLVERGDRMTACALVHVERGVDHTAAKRFVDEVAEKNTHRQSAARR